MTSIAAARSAIESQFPDVDAGSLEHLGSGWEHDAYLSADGWVFRFPRSAEAAGTFEWEDGVHRLVAARLRPVATPRIERWGVPGPHFPHPFAGHRYLPGVRADHPDGPRDPSLGRTIGEVLGRIHSVPESEARAARVEPDEDGAREWYDDVLPLVPSLRGLGPRVDPALDWLEGVGDVPDPYAGPLRLIHNDLCPDHILIDPESGRLAGILDWTDAALGDPALDFVALVSWRGWRFVDEVRVAYPLPLDDAFEPRLAFLARVMSLDWLWESSRPVVARSRERGSDVEKHVRWMENAFAGPRGRGPVPGGEESR